MRRTGLLMALLVTRLCLADTPQDFSGEWVVADKDQQAQDGKGSAAPGSHRGTGMGGGHGMGAGGGMGGMGGGHGGGRHHSDGTAPDAATGSAAAADAPSDPRLRAHALTIRQSDVVFDVAADGGKRMVYRFDNRNNYGPAYGGTVTLTWATPEMVIETHPDAGGSIEEHYTLSNDGKKLSVRIHEQHAGAEAARDLTRVFVRSGSQDAATATLP